MPAAFRIPGVGIMARIGPPGHAASIFAPERILDIAFWQRVFTRGRDKRAGWHSHSHEARIGVCWRSDGDRTPVRT